MMTPSILEQSPGQETPRPEGRQRRQKQNAIIHAALACGPSRFGPYPIEDGEQGRELTKTVLLQQLIGLDDGTETLFGATVAAIGIRVMLLDEFLVARLDLG